MDKSNERLTQTSNKGGVAFTFDLDVICQPSEMRKILRLAEKLKEYEDAEEKGLLLSLPCKVGDTVYAYCSEFGILAYTVYCIVIDKHITYQCGAYSGSIGYCQGECLDEIEPDISDFGKTVFLTQAEAEHKLKEMEP